MEYTCTQHTFTSPSERFCLLDLDENEYYLRTLQVVFNDPISDEFIYGNLHLNSRSIVFDPDNEALPLTKIRYNSHVDFECISHEQIINLYDALSINKSDINSRESSTGGHRKSLEKQVSGASPRK